MKQIIRIAIVGFVLFALGLHAAYATCQDMETSHWVWRCWNTLAVVWCFVVAILTFVFLVVTGSKLTVENQ